MKKMYLGLAIAGLLAGCATPSDNAKTEMAAPATNAVVAAGTGDNLVADPNIVEFRANSGKSDVWVKHSDKNNGLGDVGSSKVSAFEDEGSVRLRFISASDDFSAMPGLSQQVNGLAPNTDYVLSLYVEDKKGSASPTSVVIGATDAAGKELAEQVFHVASMDNAPKADRSSFRQVAVEFNSGGNTSATIFAKLKIDDASAISGDIGKATEIRVDAFSVAKK
ncbi:hypothetical protein [Vibrio superstes]|uniref:Lipoprotein n=1 Tax=Vibrio superstes NBRC 103154 TaxID=1219062 RepID=A0A511QSU5_9VIBR|nr:hypothetical protein [Vibrio superstes]GEM80428.1 hypothetical protein VSU01S_26730 [Vibrio superstes NBRC 103154]